MAISIKAVQTQRQKKDFVNLPFQIYRNNTYWVPPIRSDELKIMEPDLNPALRFCDARFWVAYQNDKPVGRIAAIINYPYNEKTGKKLGRFSRLEFFDNPEIFSALMDTAIAWLKEKGMTTAHGPLGFTNLDNQGLLIEGFDYLPSIASVYHMPYYRKYIEDYGFRKEIDWVEFRLTIGKKAIEKSNRGAALLKKRYGFEVVRFEKKNEVLPYADDLFHILNKSFDRLPFVSPIDEKLAEAYKNKYLKAVNPKYIFFLKKEEEIIGFIMGVPSLSKALQKAKGRLFPFGFYHIMKAIHHPQEVIDFYLAGVLPQYEHTGAAVILYAEIQNQMLRDGLHIIETTGEFETNLHAISNWKNFDHIQHKRRRCFIKEI
jgi:hypothetical protein